jgi:hypothetical protein
LGHIYGLSALTIPELAQSLERKVP